MTTTVKKQDSLSFDKGRSASFHSEVTLGQVFASMCVRVTETFRPHQSAATHIWWDVLPFKAAVLAGKLLFSYLRRRQPNMMLTRFSAKPLTHTATGVSLYLI